MKLKNPVFFYLFFVFIMLNVADAITAFFIKPAEANPLFLLTGSLIPVILVKALVIYGFYFYYKRNIYKNHMMYYYFISLLVFGIILIGLGVTSNIIGMTNPEIVSESAALDGHTKVSAYSTFILIIYMIPLILNFIIFWLYDKSTKYVKFDKEFYKRRRWKP